MSMGIVLIGGLLSSLFLTLFLVPAMYVTANHLGTWLSKRRGGRARPQPGDQEPLAPPARVTAGAMGD
jgi:hypothetical protein